MIAAIYARVSTGKQEFENQAVILRDFAKKQGWEIVEYTDQASGSTSDREAFNRLFEDARYKKFDLVLFWALDRFSREGALKTLTMLQELQTYGVQWKSYSEQYLDSLGPFRDVIISIMATIAKLERQRISDRTKAGLAVARAKGKTLGHPRRIFDREELIRLHGDGWSSREIGELLGISKDTVRNTLKEMAKEVPVIPTLGNFAVEEKSVPETAEPELTKALRILAEPETPLERARRMAKERQNVPIS